MSLKDKKIVLGITGSIASYKACDIIRSLTQKSADVYPILTRGGEKFITEMTLQTLSGNKVRKDIYSLTEESEINHIHLADTADAILIAPANANILAKLSVGICDDLLTTMVLATQAPIFIAPAMNVNMYKNPITQKNILILKELGFHFIGPATGSLACGWEGLGRMEEPQKIVETLDKYFI